MTEPQQNTARFDAKPEVKTKRHAKLLVPKQKQALEYYLYP